MANEHLNGEFQEKCVLCFLSFKMNFFWGAQPKVSHRQLYYTVPSCPLSLFQPPWTEEPGVWPWCGMGWLSKLENVLVITFYCCLPCLNFQIPCPLSQPAFLHPASYLILAANLTLAPFLQKHLTLCKNLASILSSAGLGQLASAGNPCQTACLLSSGLCHNSRPLFPGKRAVATSCICQETFSNICFKMLLPGIWTKPN